MSFKEYDQTPELLNLHCSWVIPPGHRGLCRLGCASLLAAFMDSGRDLGDFVIDTVQINFLLHVLKITDVLGDLSVI